MRSRKALGDTPADQRVWSLQWGRDGEVAESKVPGSNFPVYLWLQWGRDGEVAERWKLVDEIIWQKPLQWGRDGEVAERVALHNSRAAVASASMGPRR